MSVPAKVGPPTENWFKCPNAIIDHLDEFTSLAELKLVLYVARHTWGYQEYTQPKALSLDDLEHGRHRRDGSRMDGGTGLSRPTIIRGKRAASEHGWLEITSEPGKDAGRARNLYRLRIAIEGNNPADAGVTQCNQSDVTPIDLGGNTTLPRSEKETLSKIPGKDTSSLATAVRSPRRRHNPVAKKTRVTVPKQQMDEMAAAIEAALDLSCRTRSAQGALRAACKEIILAGGRPEEVAARAARYYELYDGITLTPSALKKHWDLCDPARASPRGEGRKRETLSERKWRLASEAYQRVFGTPKVVDVEVVPRRRLTDGV